MGTLNNLPTEVYRATLLERLINFFPDLAQDEDFIARRSLTASKIFQERMLKGEDYGSADAAANERLFAGLVFSPFATIKEVLATSYEDVVPLEQRSEKARMLLPLCAEIFDRYPTDDDAFESSIEYDTELIPELTVFIEKHV